MASLTETLALIEQLVADLESLAFGDDATSVTHSGQTRDSVAKAIKSKFDALQAMVQGRLTYETKAAMDAAGAPPAGELAEVWNDSTPENNGLYGYAGGVWVKSDYDLSKLEVGNNLLLDPLNQYVTKFTTLNDFNHFYNYVYDVVANPISPAGKSLKSVTNDGAESSKIKRDFDISPEFIGLTLNYRILGLTETAGFLKIIYRDSARTIISQTIVSLSAGQTTFDAVSTVPENTDVVTIMLQPDSGGYATIHFFGASPYGFPSPIVQPDFVSLIDSASKSSPILFDPLNDFSGLSSTFSSYTLINAGEAVMRSDNRYPVITNTIGNRVERLYPLELSDVLVGDVLNFLVTGTSSNGGTVKIHFRNPDRSIHSFVGSSVLYAGDFEWRKTDVTVPIAAGYVSVLIDVSTGETADLISVFAAKYGNTATAALPYYRASQLYSIISATSTGGAALGVLTVSGTQLSHSSHYVESAREISAGLWEYTAGGHAYRVRTDSPDVVIKVSDDKYISLMLVSGQSLSVGASSGATIDPAASIEMPIGMMLCPAGYPTQGPNDVALIDADITALQYQYADSSTSYSPGMSASYHAIRFGHRNPILLLSHGISGKTIEYLYAGNSFANAAIQIRKAKQIIESYGLEIAPEISLIWNQGEANGSTPSADYLAAENTLFDGYISTIETELGAGYSVSFLIDQVGRSYSVNPTRAQAEVARLRDDTGVILSKAAIQLQYNMNAETSNGDSTHVSKNGYYILGAYWGKAFYDCINKGTVKELQPEFIQINGNIVFVKYKNRLFVDNSITVTNNNFDYSDDSGNTILSTEIAGSTVVITMSASIESAANRKLSLGLSPESTGNYLGSDLYMMDSRIVHELNWPLRDYLTSFEMSI